MIPIASIPCLIKVSKSLVILSFCFGAWLPAFAQSGSIIGRLKDTLTQGDCSHASVMLLSMDSAVVKACISSQEGVFILPEIHPGRYILQVTHAGYFDLFIPVLMKGAGTLNVGLLILISKIGALASVTVRPAYIRPHMRDDTLEYNTANILMPVNASVEDMLRILPGIQIGPDGSITVNGQKIQRVLVNGEDFFGSSPTVATKNLNAEMIDKVQVLDKKSRLAELTGIDDGQTTKTLNLTLKQTYKHSYLISGLAGSDGDKYYNANGMGSFFSDARQVAILGLISNTGSNGVSGSAGGTDAAGLSVSTTNNDPLGSSAGTGVPRIMGVGGHYADRWKGDGDHINANYQVGYLSTKPYSTSLSEQILPDSIYGQQQQSNSVNSHSQNDFNGQFDFALDSLSGLHVTAIAQTFSGTNQFNSSTESYFNDTLTNMSQRTVRSTVSNDQWWGAILYRVRSRKVHRKSFFIYSNFTGQNNTSNGYLFSPTTYYAAGNFQSADTTDQRKYFGTENRLWKAGAGFTQPIRGNLVLAVKYDATFSHTQAIQSTYGKGDGKYTDLVDSLSSNFISQVTTQNGTINLQFKRKGFNFTLGLDFSGYTYRENNLFNDTVARYNYFYFTPRLDLRKNFTPFTGLELDYGQMVQPPSIAQLQPVTNNNNPLSITLGNPGLRPSATYSFNLKYYSLKAFIVNVGISGSLTSNSISSETATDSLGRQVTQPVNVNGNYQGQFLGSVQRKIVPLQVDVGLNAGLTVVRSNNYVNAELSKNQNYNGTAGLSLSRAVPEKYSFQAYTNFSYLYSLSSINNTSSIHYWGQNHYALLTVYFRPAFELNSTFSYIWQQATSPGGKGLTATTWNAYLGHKFLANRLTIRFQVSNILGQNSGISRSSTANQTTESTTNIIGRYYMLTCLFKMLKHHGDH
jgi:hypothetical protein